MKKIIIILLLAFGADSYGQTIIIPSSGALTMGQIAYAMWSIGELTDVEVDGSYSLSFLNSKSHLADKTAPFSISDWYGYTTPTPPTIPCGSSTSFSGGASFPTSKVINLGTATGTVTLNFDASAAPDKFIVIYDGVEVINTGYRGVSSAQSSLNAALAARGLPPETIVSYGPGSMSFNKTTTTATATVNVYAPLSGTAWNYTLSCPVP